MLKSASTFTSTLLVTYMTLCLMGCTAKSALPSNKPNKIDSASNNINAPYKVVGGSNNRSTMEDVKRNLKNASGNTNSNPAVSALRSQALRETALSIGARGGLAERAQQINGTLLNYEPVLAKVFQFYGLILDDNVLPPVLVEARNTLNLAGGDAIRIADRSYKLIAQARFITAAPTWREYLWMAYDAPELPDRSLLPRNKPERIMWERDLEEGWQAGLHQGDLIFSENIHRLVRDFNGMILYRRLLSQRMVSPPFVATLDMGVTGNGHDMNINDKVLRITAFPELQSDSRNWKTELHSYE